MTYNIDNLKKSFAKDESPNKQGNDVYRGFSCNLERYFFDFGPCTPDQGWTQFDTNQDASYFGVWINKAVKQTLSYCEGDITLVQCNSTENFNAEIKDMIDFYEPGRAFATIDNDGTFTEYYQDQSDYFIH